jgi:hypothetical protein
MDPAPPAEFSTCLGDLYSVAWLEDADANDLRAETLRKQYHRVRARASNNFTYVQGSHVMRYGALDMDEEAAARWEGVLNDGKRPRAARWDPGLQVLGVVRGGASLACAERLMRLACGACRQPGRRRAGRRGALDPAAGGPAARR